VPGFAAAVLGLLLVSPRVALAEEPTIDAVTYNPTELPPDAARGRVLIVGVALTAVWYGAGVGTSYLWPDAPNARDLRLPVVGPWLALADTGCGAAESGCTTLTVVGRTAMAIVSGVGQFGGVMALLEGTFMDTGSAPAAKASSRASEPGAVAMPVILPGGAGVELIGRF
jgi:hypothetical protein